MCVRAHMRACVRARRARCSCAHTRRHIPHGHATYAGCNAVCTPIGIVTLARDLRHATTGATPFRGPANCGSCSGKPGPPTCLPQNGMFWCQAHCARHADGHLSLRTAWQLPAARTQGPGVLTLVAKICLACRSTEKLGSSIQVVHVRHDVPGTGRGDSSTLKPIRNCMPKFRRIKPELLRQAGGVSGLSFHSGEL